MRTLRIVLLVVVAASCGLPTDPPGRREDPLGPCAQLTEATCSTRSDCSVEPLFCTQECRLDGHGGCLPCESYRCVVALPPPPPPPACETLDAAACGARTDCQASFAATTCPACPPNADCSPCPEVFACLPKPPSCEALNAVACSVRPDCRTEATTCACVAAPCDCEPELRCVSAPPDCSALDESSCSARADCRVLALGACLACEGDTCPDCTSTFVCVSVNVEPPPPAHCADLDEVSCSARSDCRVESVSACPSCLPGGPCPDCTTRSVCVPVEVSPPACGALEVDACSSRPDCAVQEFTACPVCRSGEACPPCRSTLVCAPVEPPPSPCSGLDEASCNANSACLYETYACTAECRDDGNGGCLPCVVPPPSCQPRHESCGDGRAPPPAP